MNTTVRKILAGVAIALGLALAFWLGTTVAARREAPTQPDSGAHDEQAGTIYTCSMHPQIRQPRPGRCPLCGMDLIPVPKESSSSGARQYSVSPEALKLMEIETAQVERRPVETELRMTGKVAYDETRLAYLTARFPGRLDKVYVDFTGVSVKAGDPMADIYSPELIAAQEELLQAARTTSQAASAEPGLRTTAQVTLDAARDKLRLWGITTEQIAEVEKRGTVSDTMTLCAPAGGVVIKREGQLGLYVQTGTQLYTIVDLSDIWVKLDAYESDLPLLKPGQKATVTVEALPGRTFDGVVAFIDPVVQPMTRTAKVRLNMPNPDLLLKPEMFVRASLHASIGDGPALVIPASAPLITGKRAVVYVQLPDAKEPAFEGRDVLLGPRAGDYYVVAGGLNDGEMVVTRGNFKIDSAIQIQGKPSMMQPEGGGATTGHQHGGATAPAPADAADTRHSGDHSHE